MFVWRLTSCMPLCLDTRTRVSVPLPQAEFCVAKGYKADCEVIYGDTDSVMVNFKVGGGGLCVGRGSACVLMHAH
jgi:hypothetical protein